MTVLVVGSVALDNVRTPFGQVKDALGGSISYAATSASYFTQAAMWAWWEGIPGRAPRMFNRHGIDTRGLEVEKSGRPSAGAAITSTT